MKSKKPSAANSEQPEQFVFFVDESLGGHVLANALREKGWLVEVHRDHFPAGSTDETWLKSVGERGWIVLTKDDRIRYRETEKTALIRAGARAFVLTGGNLVGEEIAQAYLKAMPRMLRMLRALRAPFIVTVARGGSVSVLVGERRGSGPQSR